MQTNQNRKIKLLEKEKESLSRGKTYSFEHSHKKQKDSLETQAERAVLHAYVENQAILEPILLYRASKYKQTK